MLRGLGRALCTTMRMRPSRIALTRTFSTAAPKGYEINLPEVHAELMAYHERYETALAKNDIAELDTLFLNDDTTLRFGASDAQFGYDEIAAFRSGRSAPGPREILSTNVTTYGHDFGVANREFRRGADPRIGRQSQTWIRTAEGWRVTSAHVSWLDCEASRLEQAALRAETLMNEAADNLAGDAAIPCSGGRAFPIKVSHPTLPFESDLLSLRTRPVVVSSCNSCRTPRCISPTCKATSSCRRAGLASTTLRRTWIA